MDKNAKKISKKPKEYIEIDTSKDHFSEKIFGIMQFTPAEDQLKRAKDFITRVIDVDQPLTAVACYKASKPQARWKVISTCFRNSAIYMQPLVAKKLLNIFKGMKGDLKTKNAILNRNIEIAYYGMKSSNKESQINVAQMIINEAPDSFKHSLIAYCIHGAHKENKKKVAEETIKLIKTKDQTNAILQNLLVIKDIDKTIENEALKGFLEGVDENIKGEIETMMKLMNL